MKALRLSLRTKLLALIVAMLFATAIPLVLTALDYLWKKELKTAEDDIAETLSILAMACEETLAKSIFMKATAMEVAKYTLKGISLEIAQIVRRELFTKSPKEIIAHLGIGNGMHICFLLQSGEILGSEAGIAKQDTFGITLADIVNNQLSLGEGHFYVFSKEVLYLGYFVPLPQKNLVLAISMPLKAIRELTQHNIASLRKGLEQLVATYAIQDRIFYDVLYRNDEGILYGSSKNIPPEKLLLVDNAVKNNQTHLRVLTPQGPVACFIRPVRGPDAVIIAIGSEGAFVETVFPLFMMHCTLFGLLVLLAVLVTSWLAMRLFSPLRQLTQLATVLPKLDYTKPVNLNIQLPVQRQDEIGDLARSLSHFTELLHDNVSNVVRMTALKESIANELAIASKIQSGFLPQKDGQLENHPKFSIASRIVPEKEIGGDLYDYFLKDKDTLCITIGDVSGHGVPAALFMSQCLTLLRGAAENSCAPEKIVETANRTLAAQNPENMFVSLFFGCYNINDGRLTFCLAGHPPPILMAPDSVSCSLIKGIEPDLVVGLMPDVHYASHTVQLKSGETLFLYTDGISEAVDSKGVFFGEQAIVQTLNGSLFLSAEEIADAILAAVARFTAGVEPNDDRTILVLQRKG